MTGFEGPVLKLGSTLASHVVKSWLQRRRGKKERESSLAELAADEVKGPLERRQLENFVEDLGLRVAGDLAPFLTTRFPGLPENESAAAFAAVNDTLGKVDLSDEALLADDVDPEQLARRVRAQFPGHARSVLLSPQGAALYDLALDQACRHLVSLVRYLPSFPHIGIAELLKRLNQQSSQLDELLARTPRTSLDAPHGTDHDEQFREEYLNLVAHRLDKLELLGLTMEDQAPLPLTVAYLSLSVSSSRADRFPKHTREWFEWQPAPDSATTVRVEDAIGASRRMLVRGEAGTGKTTLLDWLAVTAARNGFTGRLAEWNGFVPFKIRLRGFTEGELPGADQFVPHMMSVLAGRAPVNWADRVLRTGKAMVLVDGVDEVSSARRRKVRDWLSDLVLAYPEARFVVTSRTAAADQNWLTQDDFGAVLMEPMTAADIHALVERWHRAAAMVRSSTNVDAAQRRLLKQLDSRPDLRALASTPLLCAMLCALNLAHRSELPRDRMDLYRKALAMLLHMRDAEREIPVLLNEREKQILLGHLAWRLTSGNKVELPADEVREHLAYRLRSLPLAEHGPDDVLRNLLERSGVLRSPAEGRVDFVHRTFQEFLAANEATEAGYLDTLVANAHRDTWRETVVMACGHAKQHQARKLLTEILDRADTEPTRARTLRLVAAACLETVSNVDPEVIERVERVVQDHLVPPRSGRETRSLSSIGGRLLRYLPETLDGLSEASAAATVEAVALSAGDDALPLLRRYAQDPRGRVQEQLAVAWKYFDPERFAHEVLAEAPLDNGSIWVNEERLLPWLGHLRKLDRLGVGLFDSGRREDLSVLRGVPALQRLSVGFAEDATVDLAPLTEHSGLADVSLFGAKRYVDLRSLKSLRRLRRLSILRDSDWRGLAAFGELTQIEDLRLSPLTRVETLDALAALGRLTRLEIWDCPTGVLARTKPITAVRRLNFVGFSANGGALAELARVFPAVTNLNLHETPLDRLADLGSLALRDLSLTYCPIPDLRPITTLPQLRTLTIMGNESPVDVSVLADMEITLNLQLATDVVGREKLGPGVKVIG